MSEDNQPYWKGRIDKIDKKDFVDTVLKDTWIVDNTKSLYKPCDTEQEFQNLLTAYVNNKDNLELRNIVFNKSLWFAAYISVFARQKYGRTFTWDMDHYLGFAMKRLWEDIKLFNPKENASFYTYVLNDYSFRIRKETEDVYGNNHMTTGVRIRMNTVLFRAIKIGMSFNDLKEMDDEEFYDVFETKKSLFLKMIAFKDLDSLNRAINEQDGSVSELQDYFHDEYSSTFVDRIITKMTLSEIYELAEKMYSSNVRNYHIWKDYMTTDMTLEEVGEKYGNMSRERIRQIVTKTNKALRSKRKVKALKECILY